MFNDFQAQKLRDGRHKPAENLSADVPNKAKDTAICMRPE